MNLVNELQVSTERDDVLTLLRKAKRLASKLDLDDITNWLNCEQSGYPDEELVPEYRLVSCQLIYSTNGPVAVGFGVVADGTMEYPRLSPVDQPIRQSMNEVISMLAGAADRSRQICLSVDDDVTEQLRRTLHPVLARQAKFLFRANLGQLGAIPDAVKDKVLDWALELERRGVKGENMTFDASEKAAAHNITFNITGSQIGQLNNLGNNLTGGNGNG